MYKLKEKLWKRDFPPDSKKHLGFIHIDLNIILSLLDEIQANFLLLARLLFFSGLNFDTDIL